ncbi:MAG: hypothetical protein OXU66_05270 [Gammaproteobacteria bacterium]|nr:hypothetical protein [Gammaproteobacteria bacterium]MDD9894755.1 hypothetical protein [Gammaproteobacteria bacterium]MDD9958333.1 hypothetical protein [Gammaproteobacteria bacterium]
MSDSAFIRAQAHLHHAYLLGLQLMLSSNKEPALLEEWSFRLFRRQHEQKFLSSFEKLGLSELSDAVACAQYHVVSNAIGGVGVEYMYESDQKAWVRFRYPRWMFKGPTICGVPNEICRGFLRGWYAHNGVSLKNPRLGFVCVSEDMTGEIGFCGYFKEYDHELSAGERLAFAKDEMLPEYKQAEQPVPPVDQWNEERLEKANRNYAIEFIRNSLIELMGLIGRAEAQALGSRAARLIGLQYFQETREMIGAQDGDLQSAVEYLEKMFRGMGDKIELVTATDGIKIGLIHSNLRIVRSLEGEERDLIFSCWQQLWHGAMSSFRVPKQLQWEASDNRIRWTVSDLTER